MPGFLTRGMNAVAMWLADDDGNALGTAANPLRTTSAGGTGTNANQVQGTSANNANDDGTNPVKTGGVYKTGVPGAANGQRTDFLTTPLGALVIATGGNNPAGGALGNQITLTNDLQSLGRVASAANVVYDPASAQMYVARGTTDGSWTVPGLLPAATDRSGTATTSSNTLAAANASRRGLNIQNIGANNIGVNEFGGTAAIGTAGTYTLAPGASMNIRTNRAVTVIAATASTAYSATEF